MLSTTSEAVKEYPLGYKALFTGSTTTRLSEDLELKSYSFDLIKNGYKLTSFNTFDNTKEVDRKVYEYIENSEIPAEEKQYLLANLSGDSKYQSPWEREKPTRKLLSSQTEILSSLNDEGNAVRFEEECKGWLIYDKTSEEWYAWCGNRWEKAGEKIGKAIRFVCRSIEHEYSEFVKTLGNDIDSPETKKAVEEFKKFAGISRNYFKQIALKKMLESSAMQTEFEKTSDKKYLGFKNGSIDTETGEFIPLWDCGRIKESYPTVYIDRYYTEGQKSKALTEFMKSVFTDTNPNLSEEERFSRMSSLGRYFLRLLGYSMVFGNPEQLFIFLCGKGSNGKSTLVDTIRYVLGSEVSEASVKELYMNSEDRPASGISSGLSSRILLFSEASDDEDSKKGGRISRDTVKVLTGDAFTSRFRGMYAKSKQQAVVCTPIGVTNELPRFDKVPDSALLRRVVTVVFPRVFSSSEQVKNMRQILYSEADAIFSMVADELRAYCMFGLVAQPEFCRSEQNELLAGFEFSQFVKTLEKTDGSVRVSRRDLEDKFIEWCGLNEVDVKLSLEQVAGSLDSFGSVLKRQALTESGRRDLYKCMRVYGFEESRDGSSRFFNCKFK